MTKQSMTTDPYEIRSQFAKWGLSAAADTFRDIGKKIPGQAAVSVLAASLFLGGCVTSGTTGGPQTGGDAASCMKHFNLNIFLLFGISAGEYDETCAIAQKIDNIADFRTPDGKPDYSAQMMALMAYADQNPDIANSLMYLRSKNPDAPPEDHFFDVMMGVTQQLRINGHIEPGTEARLVSAIQKFADDDCNIKGDGAHPYSQRQAGPTTWECWSKDRQLGYK